VVLQARWPEDKLDLNQSAYRLPSDKEIRIPIFAHNFGAESVRGQLSVKTTEGWTAELDRTVTIDPMGRQELNLVVRRPASPEVKPTKVCIRGEFASAGETILCLRLLAE
jgi:hypothetical protein